MRKLIQSKGQVGGSTRDVRAPREGIGGRLRGWRSLREEGGRPDRPHSVSRRSEPGNRPHPLGPVTGRKGMDSCRPPPASVPRRGAPASRPGTAPVSSDGADVADLARRPPSRRPPRDRHHDFGAGGPRPRSTTAGGATKDPESLGRRSSLVEERIGPYSSASEKADEKVPYVNPATPPPQTRGLRLCDPGSFFFPPGADPIRS